MLLGLGNEAIAAIAIAVQKGTALVLLLCAASWLARLFNSSSLVLCSWLARM